MKEEKEEKLFRELISKIRVYNKRADTEKITRAWEFAKLAHAEQKRLSGEKFIYHPLSVAHILADWRLDTTSIIAGLLHDSIEDGGAKREDIMKEFGENACLLVDGVTKVTGLRLKGSRQQVYVENLRKMLLVMAKDLRVILVKLADRLHNMQTLSSLPEESQKENAQETLEIYAPLAERLGIGEIKGQLEDLVFPFAYPKEYRQVKIKSKRSFIKAEEVAEKLRRKILKRLAKEKIFAEIRTRKKHLYSLWIKLIRPEVDWDFSKIYDVVAMRIIVNTVPECYTVLGVVHAMFKPVPHIGISDFIAQPKPNGYQSIHTKIFGPGERIVEVQIRTHKMHKQAEFGIAAHWAYGEVKSKGMSDETLEKMGVKIDQGKISWVKQLVKWQKEITGTKEFLRAVKFDALTHRNFIFSPGGDVYDLPSGATPIDFAYAVHTDLGNYLKAVKVDGKIVSLDYKLKSGEVVEIMKSKTRKKPSHSWIDSVVTTAARREINKSLRNDSK